MLDKPVAAVIDADLAFAERVERALARHFQVRIHTAHAHFLRDGYLPVTDAVVCEMGGPQVDALSLQSVFPKGRAPPMLFITASTDAKAAVAAFRAGAVDYLFKPVTDEALTKAAQTLADEVASRKRARADQTEAMLAELTPRERQVLELIGRGLSTKEIARLLILSPRTVDAHRAQIIAKTGVRRAAELIVLATQARLTG
jgi:two-component system, LuxR family, response regulator FixJ